MAGEAMALNPTRLVIAAILGLAVLLLLIIKFKVQAMVSILVGAIVIGLGAGMPLLCRSLHSVRGMGKEKKGYGIKESGNA